MKKRNEMKPNSVLILIPVYKSEMSESERIAFLRAVRIFNRRRLAICTYCGLDISAYTEILDQHGVSYQIDYFDKVYFRSTEGYNELHLNPDLYKHYLQYTYMLIYQLDAYIFDDDLDRWIEKGYDYIGAPWFDKNNASFCGIGNGGFCLKRVQWWYDELNRRIPVYSPKALLTVHPIKGIRSFFKYLLYIVGYKNTTRYLFKTYRINEDGLPYFIQSNSWRHIPHVPDMQTAIQFSFECYPSKLYALNHNKLPMGCHAWKKYEYEEFWKNYIK